LSRVINPESAGKDRTRLAKSTVLALRTLARKQEADTETRDLAAFIALALEEIAITIDPSVQAWEKRGYWVKADRFRMEWMWAEKLGSNMRNAVLEEDWGNVAQTAAHVAQKLGSIKVPDRHRMGTPWVGAWKRLRG